MARAILIVVCCTFASMLNAASAHSANVVRELKSSELPRYICVFDWKVEGKDVTYTVPVNASSLESAITAVQAALALKALPDVPSSVPVVCADVKF